MFDQLNKKSTFTSADNIAVIITGFNLNSTPHRAIGVPLDGDPADASQQIEFYLRPDGEAGNRKYPRPEIADIAQKQGVIGSVILFEGAYLDDKAGAYSARWPTRLTKSDKDFVAKRYATLRYGRDNSTGDIRSVRIDTMNLDKAVALKDPNDFQELQQKLSEMLQRSTPGSVPIVALRLASKPDPDQGGMRHFHSHLVAMATNEQDTSGNWQRCDGPRSAELFLSREVGSRQARGGDLREPMANKEIAQIEMIPGHAFYAAQQTRGNLAMDSNLVFAAHTYRGPEIAPLLEQGTGNINRQALIDALNNEDDYPAVFTESFVAVRQQDESRIYPTLMPKPADPSDPGITLQTVATAHIDPAALDQGNRAPAPQHGATPPEPQAEASPAGQGPAAHASTSMDDNIVPPEPEDIAHWDDSGIGVADNFGAQPDEQPSRAAPAPL